MILSVSDDGCGIDPLLMDKIFEPYFSTKERGKGTGLGLAVVYGIVKEYNGHINVLSKTGKGTTFNVYLPVMRESIEVRPDDKKDYLPTGNEHILLVEDEQAVARLEQQILHQLGYQVTRCSEGISALRIFSDDPAMFDLVITDMAMPNMTGRMLAEQLLEIRPDLPIIVCTGYSGQLDVEKAAAIGIKGFISKPLTKSKIAETVRNAIDKAKCLKARE